MTSPVSFDIRDQVALVAINNPPVNAMSQAVRQGLLDALSKVDAEHGQGQLKALVLSCEGRTFVAGADISEFGKPPMAPHLPDVLNGIEQCGIPVVAAIHGTALGGGLELALAAHARVARHDSKLGLPEVNLGLIPGAGGTQRLPRVIGFESALEMITTGKPISASKALTEGLVDRVCDSDSHAELIEAAMQLASELAEEKPTRTSDRDVPELGDSGLFERFRQALHKKARGQKAPQAAVESIENVLSLSFEEGVARERELFLQLKASPQSTAMRHAFFAERSCAKIPGLAKDLDLLDVHTVGVIGAGTMGTGIAMCFASAGIKVQFLELSAENLERGLQLIQQRYDQSVERGRISADKAAACVSLVNGTCEYSDLSDADLIVEAAFESMQVKKDIFSTLDKVCKPSAILASNTSYLNIDDIAAVTQRPDRVLGMHFFSPAHVMKLLEVVRARETSEQVLASVMLLGKRIGKIACAVGVCYGFVGNRMYSCYGREANALLLEGSTPAEVDAAMQDWGMAMGPLAVTDMSGIDIGYKARRERPDPPNDTLYFRAADLMVENERLGQKTNAGFYRYENGQKTDDEAVVQLLRAEAKSLGIQPRDITREEIQQRLTLALINEGARILEENIAIRASDIDVIWLNGYGFPRWRGGPMCYADELGLANVVEQLKAIQNLVPQASKAYWEPANLLRSLAEKEADEQTEEQASLANYG